MCCNNATTVILKLGTLYLKQLMQNHIVHLLLKRNCVWSYYYSATLQTIIRGKKTICSEATAQTLLPLITQTAHFC